MASPVETANDKVGTRVVRMKTNLGDILGVFSRSRRSLVVIMTFLTFHNRWSFHANFSVLVGSENLASIGVNYLFTTNELSLRVYLLYYCHSTTLNFGVLPLVEIDHVTR